MILQSFALLMIAKRGFCIQIEPNGCEKVKSNLNGFFDTFLSKHQNEQCKGQLRFRKNGKVYCLQKEDSWDEYFECQSKGKPS